MRFGVLEHRGITFDEDDESKKVVNVGDAFQIMAVKNLYHEMGIADEEIVHIDWWEMNQYRGEYVILPINLSMFVNSGKQSFADMSPRIIPVFLGASFKHTDIDERQFEFFKRYEPIGCRDERTMELLRKNNIEAYLAGCLACTLPQVKYNSSSKTKIFFVDAPAIIKDYIPEEIKKNMECLTHEFYVSKKQVEEDPSSEKLAQRIIRKYAEEAKLVVTSRFHSACLCLALGIPVILVAENNFYKFSWLSKILPLYTPEQFSVINWNPPALELENLKENMKEVAIERIRNVYKEKMYYGISEYFENENRSDAASLLYYHEACQYIDEKWNKESEIEYAFWGMTENMLCIDEYIRNVFPNAKLVGVYDTFRDGVYNGLVISKPTKENLQGNKFIIVTSNSAADIAEELFVSLGKSEETFFLCRLNFLRM